MADVKPFNEIAKQFDPRMDPHTYDMLRQQYFDTFVRPKVSKPYDVTATWNEFRRQTERPKLIPDALIKPGVMGAAAIKSLTEPFKDIDPRIKAVAHGAGAIEQRLAGIGQRQGVPTQGMSIAGDIIGSAAPLSAAFTGAGAVLEEFALPAMLTRIARGGLAFGAYEWAKAEGKDRGVAGLKGFAYGAAFDGALGIGGKLLSKVRGMRSQNVEQAFKDAMTADKSILTPPEIDKVVADEIIKDNQVAREEGRPITVKADPNVRGVQVLLNDAQGKAMTVKVESMREAKAVEDITRITKSGGGVQAILHHPEELGLLNRFMKLSADMQAEKYENVRRIRTPEGRAREVATQVQLEGKAAEAVSSNEVHVHEEGPKSPFVKGEEGRFRQMQRALEGQKDEEGNPLSRGEQFQLQRHLQKVWDPQATDVAKGASAKVLAGRGLEEFLPPKWIVDPQPANLEQASKESVESLATLKETQGDKFSPAFMEMLEKMISDPNSIDLDVLRGTSEAELNMVQEISEKGRGIESPGALEEAKRRGEIQPMAQLDVPRLVSDPKQGFRTETLRVNEGPHRTAIRIPSQEMENIAPGVSAFVTTGMGRSSIERDLGLPISMSQKPMVVYGHGMNRRDVYHEGLHIGLHHVGGDMKLEWLQTALQQKAAATARKLGSVLSKYEAYKGMTNLGLLEEAYVHSATAIRMNDAKELTALALMDTSVKHLYDMVFDFSQAAYLSSLRRMDTAAVRIMQRHLEDMMLRTSENVNWELKRAAERNLANIHYDPQMNQWQWTEGERTFRIPGNVRDVADFVATYDNVGEFYPSASLWSEMRGVRGPIVPRGSEPTKDLPLPDSGPEMNWKWVGWKAISGAFRPMLPWVASLDAKLNSALMMKGTRIPIYDKVKAVDEAYSAGSDWLTAKFEEASKFLQGPSQKLNDYFEFMTVEQKYWDTMKTRFRMSDKDMANVRQGEAWLRKFQEDTHIPVFDYLREQLPRLRGSNFNIETVYGGRAKDPKDMSFWHKAQTEGFNPKDNHLGRFINYIIREGFEQKYVGESLKDLQQLVNKQGKDGKYLLGVMRWPLQNYVNYMKGLPDMSQQIINRTMGDFQKFLGERFTEMNKHLPEGVKLPEKFDYPQNILNRMMVFSYVAGLGARPAIAIRDALQVTTTTLPILGPLKTMRAMTKIFGGPKGSLERAWQQADAATALLTKTNIGELYGDIFHEIPPHSGNLLDRATQLSNKLLAPSRWGHNIARLVAFHGEYDSALDAFRRFRAGRMGADDVITSTSLWFYDQPVQDRLLRLAADKGVGVEEAATRAALELVDHTLWPYRRGAQPTVLRTGVGRIFGQYGMWPLNYMDFLGRLGSKYAQYPKQALGSTAVWAASNYAAVQAMNGLGADVSKWFFVSPAGYGGSPHLELVQSLMKAPEETQEGREARRKVLEYPLIFVPTSAELKNIFQVVESDEGITGKNILKVLGFKPLPEIEKDMSLDERIEYELGFKEYNPRR